MAPRQGIRFFPFEHTFGSAQPFLRGSSRTSPDMGDFIDERGFAAALEDKRRGQEATL